MADIAVWMKITLHQCYVTVYADTYKVVMDHYGRQNMQSHLLAMQNQEVKIQMDHYFTLESTLFTGIQTHLLK